MRHLEELAQWIPALLHVVFEKSFRWHERTHVLVMLLVSGFGVPLKIAVEKDRP